MCYGNKWEYVLWVVLAERYEAIPGARRKIWNMVGLHSHAGQLAAHEPAEFENTMFLVFLFTYVYILYKTCKIGIFS